VAPLTDEEAHAIEWATEQVQTIVAERDSLLMVLRCVEAVFGQDGLGDGAEGDTIAMVRKALNDGAMTALESECDVTLWEEYEAWEADHCEHGVPPGKRCEDCEDRGEWP